MKYLLAFFLLCLTSFNLHSQNEDGSFTISGTDGFSANTTGTWINFKTVENVQGSPYLFEDWLTFGFVTTSSGANFSITEINYDAINDNIVAKINNDSLYVFNKHQLEEVVINKRKFKKNKNNHRFYEVLAVSNDLAFFRENSKTIKRGVFNPLTQKKMDDEFIVKSKVFFKDAELFKEVKLKKNNFCDLFGDKSKLIKKYIENNKLDIKDFKTYQIILNYYSTL